MAVGAIEPRKAHFRSVIAQAKELPLAKLKDKNPTQQHEVDLKPQVTMQEHYKKQLEIAEQAQKEKAEHAKQELSQSESEDSVQAAQQRSMKFEAKTGISEATLEVLNYRKRVEEDLRATSKEKQTAQQWKNKASGLQGLADQTRMIFMQVQHDVNSMSLDRLLQRIVDSGKMMGHFKSRGK